MVLAASRDGPESDRAQRYRRVGRDLVMSVQPKGSPALRKKFLMQLPPLMKDLSEGMQLVGWPEAAQREFFGKLLPAHAESLKGGAQSELDHNMMVKQLEAIFNAAVPTIETLSAADPAEPSRGARLFDHIKLGVAYQMHLKDEWQKVRLTHVSAGRSFFVFTRGRKHQETISMTSRMLSRMCETWRMRAIESTYLMERATQRARKQLAALKPLTRH